RAAGGQPRRARVRALRRAPPAGVGAATGAAGARLSLRDSPTGAFRNPAQKILPTPTDRGAREDDHVGVARRRGSHTARWRPGSNDRGPCPPHVSGALTMSVRNVSKVAVLGAAVALIVGGGAAFMNGTGAGAAPL